MLDFTKVIEVVIPEGNVINITSGGVQLWGNIPKISYVSLGDSIAVGHAINDDWEKDYGWNAQYGVNGRNSTVLVPGCYTDLIRQDLESIYGRNHVVVTSFAQSGDRVADLMNKLTHDDVRNAIKAADLVTLCIGANNVLHYALTNLDAYIASGDMSEIEALVEASLNELDGKTEGISYTDLFDALSEINPNAKFVFTTVYNPHKYLWIKEGSNGFFYHLLNNIPRMLIDVDKMVENIFGIDDLGIWNIAEWRWVSIELNLELGAYIKEILLNTTAAKTLFSRVNGIGDWVEKYIEGTDSFDGLNRILRRKISEYQSVNPNFMVADTKPIFDLFPNKTNSKEDVDYSDLVNVEFTKTYDLSYMDWGALWEGSDATTFHTNLANKYLTFKNGLPSTNVWDYVSFDMEGYANELVALIREKVIEPNVDPHPEEHGQQVLKRSFTNMFGLTKYEPNGGGYVSGDVVLNGGKLTAPNAVKADYVFDSWYTDAELQNALNPNSTDFVDYDSDITLADLVSGNTIIPKLPKVTTLYAKWKTPVTIKNLIPTMDELAFEVRSSSGTCEMSTAHSKYGSTALCNKGVSGYNEMYSMSTTKFKLIPEHIYYACVEVYQEEKLGTVDFFWPSGSPSLFGGKAPGDAGTWKKWSNVTNRSTFTEGEYPIRLDFNNGGAEGKMWFDGVMIVDLTEAFGAGNEPGNAWCQENIPYFTGVYNLNISVSSPI